MTALNKDRQRRVRRTLWQPPQEGSRERELFEQNRHVSPLLRLPPELRNRIYELVLHVGQVNVRYRPWRHQRYRMPGPVPEPGGFYCVVLAPTEDPWAAGLPEKAALPGDDAPAPHRPSCPAVQKRAAADRGHGHGMTLLSGLCRQLYQETAMLPFMLNTWSFQNRAVMDRFVLKERRLSQMQRRSIHTIFMQGEISTTMEKFFGGLHFIHGVDGRILQYTYPDIKTRHCGRWKLLVRTWC